MEEKYVQPEQNLIAINAAFRTFVRKWMWNNMANVIDVLDELQNRALKEPELKERLKNTKKEKYV